MLRALLHIGTANDHRGRLPSHLRPYSSQSHHQLFSSPNTSYSIHNQLIAWFWASWWSEFLRPGGVVWAQAGQCAWYLLLVGGCCGALDPRVSRAGQNRCSRGQYSTTCWDVGSWGWAGVQSPCTMHHGILMKLTNLHNYSCALPSLGVVAHQVLYIDVVASTEGRELACML